MKIRLLTLGKIRRPELRAVFEDYVKRISHSCPIEVNEVRDAEAAIKRLDADRAATALLLDAGGKQHDSDSLDTYHGPAAWLAGTNTSRRFRGGASYLIHPLARAICMIGCLCYQQG